MSYIYIIGAKLKIHWLVSIFMVTTPASSYVGCYSTDDGATDESAAAQRVLIYRLFVDYRLVN